MALPDTLLVNGTDLQDLVVVHDLSGLHAPGTRRGENVTYPGVRGVTYLEKVYDAYAFDIPVTILPNNTDGTLDSTPHERRAQLLSNLRDLEALLDDGLLTLTRRLAATGGGYTDHTCSAEYAAGLAMTLLDPENGQTVLQFVNLDGCWLDGLGGTHL